MRANQHTTQEHLRPKLTPAGKAELANNQPHLGRVLPCMAISVFHLADRSPRESEDMLCECLSKFEDQIACSC
jgi:hypothetical protein